jgi:hypothetical protein
MLPFPGFIFFINGALFVIIHIAFFFPRGMRGLQNKATSPAPFTRHSICSAAQTANEKEAGVEVG